MKQRLQKTICYILLFTGLGFLYYKWYQGTGFAVPCFFHAITKIILSGMRNDPLPDSSATV